MLTEDEIQAHVYKQKELGHRLIWASGDFLQDSINKGYAFCLDNDGNKITKDGGCDVTLYLMEILLKKFEGFENKKAQDSISDLINMCALHYFQHNNFINKRLDDIAELLIKNGAYQEDIEFVLLAKTLLRKLSTGAPSINILWHPINEAPKNGMPILAHCVYRDKRSAGQHVIWWHEPWSEWTTAYCPMHLYNTGDASDDMFPVCWMPLPFCYWKVEPNFKDAFIKQELAALPNPDTLSDNDLSENSINRVIDSIIENVNEVDKEPEPCSFEPRDCNGCELTPGYIGKYTAYCTTHKKLDCLVGRAIMDLIN